MKRYLLPPLLLLMLLASGCASTQQGQAIQRADRLLAEGNALEASRLYATAAAKHPKDAKLSYNHLYALFWPRSEAAATGGRPPSPASSNLEFLRIQARASHRVGKSAF